MGERIGHQHHHCRPVLMRPRYSMQSQKDRQGSRGRGAVERKPRKRPMIQSVVGTVVHCYNSSKLFEVTALVLDLGTVSCYGAGG